MGGAFVTAFLAGAIGGAVGSALTVLLLSLVRERLIADGARWPLVGIAVGLPLLAFVLYLLFGKPDANTAQTMALAAPASLDRMSAGSAAVPSAPAGMMSAPGKAPSVASLVEKLEAKLQDDPSDANGWLLLARSYEHIDQLDKARDAYRQAVVLGAEDPALAARLQEGGAATPAPAESAASDTTAASGSGVRGTVRLDPGVASEVAPDDTVFIFAKASNGQPMPIAVLRVKAGQLPMDFVLDDSLAMTSNLKLSSFDDVVVTAKISKSGDASAAAALSAPSRLARVGDPNPIELVIGGS
jgi:tetratricopeptide (TPR) repeat protein